MFIIDAFMFALAILLFFVGLFVFIFSLLFFKSNKMILLMFGHGFLLTGISLFVYSFLLVTNLFIQI